MSQIVKFSSVLQQLSTLQSPTILSFHEFIKMRAHWLSLASGDDFTRVIQFYRCLPFFFFIRKLDDFIVLTHQLIERFFNRRPPPPKIGSSTLLKKIWIGALPHSGQPSGVKIWDKTDSAAEALSIIIVFEPPRRAITPKRRFGGNFLSTFFFVSLSCFGNSPRNYSITRAILQKKKSIL